MENNSFQYNSVNGKSISNYSNSNGFVAISDVHGGNGLENALNYGTENNYSVVLNGDIVNDYHFMDIAKDLGYKTQSEIQFDYFNEKLDENEIQTFYFMQQYMQTGENIDLFLNNVPENKKEEAKEGIEGILKYSQSKEFQEKIENTYNKFKEDKLEEVKDNTYKLQALYEVFIDEEAKSVATQLNKYSNTNVLFNLGNHEDNFFVERVRNYIDNKEQLIDLTHQEGKYTIKQDNGQEISIGAMTNSVQNMPYLSEIFAPEQLEQLYSHMSIDENKKKAIMSGNKEKTEIDKLEDIIKEDTDYKRITNNGNYKNLDVFLTHGQIGMPILNDNKEGYEVPYHGAAAKLSNDAKLTIEGHIHSYYEGKNSFGNNMTRAAGKYGVIIKKDEEGNLIQEKIEVDPEYTNGHDTPIKYETEDLKEKVDKLLEQYKMHPVNNVDYEGSYNNKAA